MNSSLAQWAVLLLGLVLASLPFLTMRGWWLLPVLRAPKRVWLCVLEWLAAYALWLLVARWFEGALGQIAAQAWAFYALTLLLFALLAFPAFVWRYLWLK